jgi:hypothetical protein
MYRSSRGAPIIESDTPSPSVMRAYERRNFLVTPDRRTFIQSMYQEAARRITGNAVPANAESSSGRSVYAYTYPAQQFAQTPYSIPSQSYYHGGNTEAVAARASASATRSLEPRVGSGTPRAPSPAASARGIGSAPRPHGAGRAYGAEPEYISATPRYDPPLSAVAGGSGRGGSSFVDADDRPRSSRRPY